MQAEVTSGSAAINERLIRARELSLRIKQLAFKAGFEKVGIVPATPLDKPRERLLAWLERGYEGQMRWMARDPEKRTDPVKLFPSARSVIVVAMNYYTQTQHIDDPA